MQMACLLQAQQYDIYHAIKDIKGFLDEF